MKILKKCVERRGGQKRKRKGKKTKVKSGDGR